MVEEFSSLKGCIKGTPYIDTQTDTLDDTQPPEELDLLVTTAASLNVLKVSRYATKCFLNLFIPGSPLSPPSLTRPRAQTDKHSSQ